MEFVVTAKPNGKGRYRPRVTIPGGQHPWGDQHELELQQVGGESRKRERALLKGVKAALEENDCTSVTVIAR